MILNIQDRMCMIEELTAWVHERYDGWTEYTTISTGVLNNMVFHISRDEYIKAPNLRLKYMRLLKEERPELFRKLQVFVKKEASQ